MRINLDGPIMTFISKCVDCFLVTCCFFLCCIPIITIGASITAVSAAMLALKTDSSTSVIRAFWHSFRSDFRQATLAWLLILAVIIFLIFDYWYCIRYPAQESVYSTVLLGLAICVSLGLCCVLVYLFAMIAKFEIPLKRALLNSLILAKRNILRTVTLIFLLLMMLFVFYVYGILALPVFAVGMYWQASIISKIFQPFIDHA